MRSNCTRVFASLLLVVTALAVAVPALAAYGVPTLGQTTCPSLSRESIDLVVCGDAITGAPAGVSIHWKKCSDFEVSGWADDGTLCQLSLSGMPGRDHGNADSRWDLGPGACQTIRIGANLFDETGASGNCTDALECGTCYVFRVFAHADRNDKKSDFSAEFYCATAECETGKCTRTQGYWKNHGPGACQGGNNDNMWPANFDFCNMGQATICAKMNANPGNCGTGKNSTGSDAALKLFHQMIAAMLNLQANGTNGSCIAVELARAQALLCPYPTGCIGESTPAGHEMTQLAKVLDDYNNGRLSCASHCENGTTAPSLGVSPADQAPTKTRKSTWGEVKTIYR